MINILDRAGHHVMRSRTSSSKKRIAASLLGVLTFVGSVGPAAGAQMFDERDLDADYVAAIDRVSAMVHDPDVWDLAQRYGLDAVNVAWEDTGRYDNSSVGPNISDVTIQVPRPIAGTDEHSLALMPVLRYPNFSDKTADIAIDKFIVPVGNESGDGLSKVTLEEYLGNIDNYLSRPGRTGAGLSLLAERDTHVLVSAQAAFLPVPQQGIAEFNPVIFNYQSYAGNPAVLTIVVTREGTSATVIDNERDGFSAGYSWGQRLFFNEGGERASLTGQRAGDVNEVVVIDAEAEFSQRASQGASVERRNDGDNLVLIIQVPLKHEALEFFGFEDDSGDCLGCAAEAASDIQNAVIGHGAVEGPFTELAGLEIERDPDFPVRVTVQFYKATATGEVGADDMADIAADIDRVYEQGDYVGSLVTDGLSGRPTEYDGDHTQPRGWWASFLRRWSGN